IMTRHHGGAQLCDVASRTRVRELQVPTEDNPVFAFAPDGRLLAVAGQAITLSEVASGQMILRWPAGHCAEIHKLAFAPDGRVVVSASADETLLVWDVTSRLRGGRLPSGTLGEQML